MLQRSAFGRRSAVVRGRLGVFGIEPACRRARFDPDRMGLSMAVSLVPAVIASVALATVAGFVIAVLPGGLGVREGVLMSTLAPALGSDHAVIASLLLRLVWVAAELVAALILVPWCRHPPSMVTTVSDNGPDCP